MMELQRQKMEALSMLEDLLVQIRGIAGDAAKCGHVSALGAGAFTPEAACQAIYRLTDAAHNLPRAASGEAPAFLLESGSMQLSAVAADVFGTRSPFGPVRDV